MAYRIFYGQPEKEDGSRGFRRFALTLSCLLVFFQLVCSFWPEGREILKNTFIPGDPEKTLEAAQVFAQELSTGSPLTDAAANFCQAVLSHGYSP